MVLDVWASDGQDSFDYRRCIGRMVRFQMEGIEQATMRCDNVIHANSDRAEAV